MAVILVEGITDRIALEAVAAKLGLDLDEDGIEIVPIGGAQAVRRAYAEYEGKQVAGLCDAGEERWFRRVLGDATYVCDKDLEDELIRTLGAGVSRTLSPRRASSRRFAASRTKSSGAAGRWNDSCAVGCRTAAATSAIRHCSSR